MRTLILNILCEGQTEELFTKEVLKPYFFDRGIIVKSRLLVTSQKKKAHGGMISYQQVKKDLSIWKREVSHRRGETHFFTTMFDLYALPNDFPEFSEAQQIIDPYCRIQRIEQAFSDDMGTEGFIPYIQLHEFEALLFSDIDKLKEKYPRSSSRIDALKTALNTCHGNPELINNGPRTAPSKRIIEAVEKDKYNYNKPQSGAAAAKAIGIENLKIKCRHFREWIDTIEETLQAN